jgi:hypothetical protein
VADAARYEVLVYRPDGRLVRRIRRAVDREPVREADVSRARQEEILRAGPRYAEAIARRWALVPVPATKPAFSGIAVDEAGRLWVMAPSADGGDEAAIFDADGRYLGPVRLPPKLAITEIGRDYVLGTATDENDVEHVRLHRTTPHPHVIARSEATKQSGR